MSVWLQADPFLMLRKPPPGGEPYEGNDQYEGYCVDLARKLAEIIKFKYIIQPVKDGKYGSNENGQWNGMVGELLTGVRWL